MQEDKKYTYFVTGGGTGGHIYPAIAVARELKKSLSTKEVFYIGNPKNMEYDIVRKEGFKFLPVNVSAMPRKISFSLVAWFFKLELAIFKSLFYIFKYKPDAILGTGGYVSAPCLFAASIAGKPFMIHDSDAHPGIVSRYTSSYATAVSLAFEEAKKYVKSGIAVQVNGNPIREDFAKINKGEARNKLNLQEKRTLTIMGGSQGAKTINDATVGMLKNIAVDNDIQVIFQTGKKKFVEVQEALECVWPEYKDCKNLILLPYFDDMVSILSASDVVISRAGSLSLSEICACSLPSILVPYPYAAADHQRKNALAMKEIGASEYLEDAECNTEILQNIVLNIFNDENKYNNMRASAGANAKLSATKSIVKQLKSIIR